MSRHVDGHIAARIAASTAHDSAKLAGIILPNTSYRSGRIMPATLQTSHMAEFPALSCNCLMGRVHGQAVALFSLYGIFVRHLAQNLLIQPFLDDLPRLFLRSRRDMRDDNLPCRAFVGLRRA